VAGTRLAVAIAAIAIKAANSANSTGTP